MPNINYANALTGRAVELDFADLDTLIKGASIKRLFIDDDFFQLELTDAFKLRIQGQQLGIHLVSVLNQEDIPPVRLKILKDGEVATAQAIEKRLHALRQLYAATFLINAGRSDEIANFKVPESEDLEDLLAVDERLFVSAASEGSFWLTVVTKTTAGFKSLSIIFPLFYSEGRTALLERLRAQTELKKLAAEQKRTCVVFDRANKILDLTQKIAKIKDPWQRAQAERVISSHLAAFGEEPLALPSPIKTETKSD
jgi:hypothetical protein